MITGRSGFTLLLLCLLALAGCSNGPEPRYEGPAGQGRLVYEPGRGIVRQGSKPNLSEQAAFDAVQKAFDDGRHAECIQLSLQMSEDHPEGSRVVEAILLRIRSRMQLGRSADSAFPQAVSLDRIFFVYLAPDTDSRLRALLAREPAVSDFARELRGLELVDFAGRLGEDALAISRGGHLAAAQEDCRKLLTYYLPVQELRQFRQQTSELARDLAWLAYAAGDMNRVLLISEDLLAMNPSPSVKGDTLYIRAHALSRNGAHAFAKDTFERLFRTAGLRDNDTRWRPYALAAMIRETMATSKGPEYDLVPYEHALELVGEYELYRIENPNVPPRLAGNFVELAAWAMDVLIARDLNAAETYRRLGEPRARDTYLENARRREAERDSLLARLRKQPGERE